jgi:hypothetical protein
MYGVLILMYPIYLSLTHDMTDTVRVCAYIATLHGQAQGPATFLPVASAGIHIRPADQLLHHEVPRESTALEAETIGELDTVSARQVY